MRVLYFAPQYYLDEGGRTHARSFFIEMAKDPRVTHAIVFPPDPGILPPGPARQAHSRRRTPSGASRGPNTSILGRIRSPLRTQLELLMPSASMYSALSAALAREEIDTAVLRLGSQFRYVGRIRSDHPRVRLCIEYNACSFDERLKGVGAERLWRREEAGQLDRADCIGVVSEHLRRYLESARPSLAGKIFVNPNGGDPGVFSPPDPGVRAKAREQLGIPDDALVLGYVGGMETWRQIPLIVSWLARARQTGLSRLFLVLVGAGHDLPQVLKTIEDHSLHLAGRVRCSEGWVASSEVPRLMAAFDAGLLSFQYPHCCQQKAFEYLLCGLPAIGPAGSIPEVLLAYGCGTFEFAHDFESFLTVVGRLQDDLRSARASAQRGRDLVATEFTWAANASRVLDALERSR